MDNKDKKSIAETLSDALHRLPHDQHRFMGMRTSYLWALAFTAVLAVWLLSGDIVIGGQKPATDSAGEQNTQSKIARQLNDKSGRPKSKLFGVRTRLMSASPRDATLKLRGRTEADAKVSVMPETSGVVIKTPVIKGSFVKKGTPLCILDPAARAATVAQYKGALSKAQADAKASGKLVKRGFAGKLKVTTDQAQLSAARAAYDLAKLDLARTEIRAPFSGVVEEQSAKVGNYLQSGFGSSLACAVMVDIDPLIVVVAVSELNISKLARNMKARVKLVTGETVNGKIRFIATSADPKTRTFRVEIAVANAKWKLRAGVTADIVIPLKAAPAHFFTPAILSLNDAGQIGVRIVDDKNIVRFKPISILANDVDGVWVAGLAERARVITVGQAYVIDGQEVVPHDETAYGAINKPNEAQTIR